MEKYYTPKIEEFVEGFRFEYLGDRIYGSRWHEVIYREGEWTKESILVRISNTGFHANMIRAKVPNN